MTNRALLYGNFVNENFFGGGVTMNLAPFLDWETLDIRDQTSKVRHLTSVIFKKHEG